MKNDFNQNLKEEEKMTNIVENRHEIFFIYDAKYCNPNGDPGDENKPRTDPETGINLVTDVRLKRTIRDYLYDVEKKEIFVRLERDEEGYLPDAKERAKAFLPDELKNKKEKINIKKEKIDENILSKCIDVRLFGATIPLELKDEKGKDKTTSITHTGPVQFQMGRSFHKVIVERIKGTGAFASQKKKEQQAFRTEYIVPYSLIGFYGVVNEHRAKETRLTEDDLAALYRGMWLGTKNMITRSKLGLTPRILLVIRYKPGNFQMSDLDSKLAIKSDKPDIELRNTQDYVMIADELVDALNKYKEKIEKILIKDDNTINFVTNNNEPTDLTSILKQTGIPVEELNLE